MRGQATVPGPSVRIRAPNDVGRDRGTTRHTLGGRTARCRDSAFLTAESPRPALETDRSPWRWQSAGMQSNGEHMTALQSLTYDLGLGHLFID